MRCKVQLPVRLSIPHNSKGIHFLQCALLPCEGSLLYCNIPILPIVLEPHLPLL